MVDDDDAPDDVQSAQVEEDLAASDVPDDLDEYASAAWLQMTPIMERAGRLKRSDLAAWKRYCHNAGRYWKAAKELRDFGSEFYDVPTVAVGADGQPGVMTRRRPQCLTMEKLLPELRQQEDRFGMSPMSRANLVQKGLRGGRGSGDLFGGTADANQEEEERPDPSSFN